MVNMALVFTVASIALLVFPAVGAPDLTGGIINSVPTITSVSLSSISLTPTAGTTTTLTTTIVVADLNGYNDVATVTVEILKPDGTSHVAAGAATFSTGTGTAATYTKTSTMNFYDAAALLTSTYKVKVVVTDVAAGTVNNAPTYVNAGFNYAELAALNSPSSLSLGTTLAPGDTSSVGSLAIQNYGNVRIDTQVSGTAPTITSPSATLPVASLDYSVNSNMASSADLSTSSSTIAAWDLTAGASSSRTMYWTLAVPAGSSQYVPAGTYTSTVTLGAVAG